MAIWGDFSLGDTWAKGVRVDPLQSIDLNLLVALHHLVETESVQRAAAELGVGQPAMSATLGRLRLVFDDALLIRAGRGLKRTLRADELRAPVRDLVNATRDLLVPVSPFDPSVDGWTPRVAMGDDTRPWLGPRLALRIGAEAPQVDLRLRRLTMDSPRAGRSGEIDLAVFPYGDSSRGPDVSMFVLRDLCDVSVVLATAPEHPVKVWDLAAYVAAEHVLVTWWDQDERGWADDALERLGLARRLALTVPTFSEAIDVVRRSTRVVLLPHQLAAGSGLTVHPLPWGEYRYRLVCASHPRSTRDPRVRWLRRCLEECVVEPERAQSGA